MTMISNAYVLFKAVAVVRYGVNIFRNACYLHISYDIENWFIWQPKLPLNVFHLCSMIANDLTANPCVLTPNSPRHQNETTSFIWFLMCVSIYSFLIFFTLYEYHKLPVMTSKGTIPVHLSVFMSIKTKLRAYVFRMQHRESMRDNSEYVLLVRSCTNGLSIVIAFPFHFAISLLTTISGQSTSNF